MVDASTSFARAIGQLLQAGERAQDVAVVESAHQALSALKSLRPDIVLVSIGLGDVEQAELAARIGKAVPEANIIAMAESSGGGISVEMTPSRHVAEDAPAFELTPLGSLADQPSHARPSTSSARKGGPDRGAPSLLSKLTAREREILGLLAEGKSGQEIATRLSVSPNTVRSHIQNIRAKLNVRSRLEAVTYAIRHGLGGGPTESYENETSR